MKKYRRSMSKYYGNNIHMKLAIKQQSTKSYQHIVNVVTDLSYSPVLLITSNKKTNVAQCNVSFSTIKTSLAKWYKCQICLNLTILQRQRRRLVSRNETYTKGRIRLRYNTFVVAFKFNNLVKNK